MKTPVIMAFVAAALLMTASAAQATTYEVGPGKAYENINDVPWESIAAGDTVLIYWREAPYKEKWVICAQGTEELPITVAGVPGPNGELPVIDGIDATTRVPQTNYWGENRSIIKVGGANIPADTTPQWIVIENLEVKSGRPPYYFTGRAGRTAYSNNAAAIWVEKCEHFKVKNCIMRDSGNGFFVSSSDDLASRDILVEGCYLYGNSNTSRTTEHNSYCAALGILYQYNRYGPVRTGTGGTGLKDRSAGMVVRYNWIELSTTAGNRELDLVNGEDSILIRTDPTYLVSHVYGNILVEGMSGNRQIVHYGGDGGSNTTWRNGTLHFYNNTIVSTRTDRNTLFRLSGVNCVCDFRNCIYETATTALNEIMASDAGLCTTVMSHCWLNTGWVKGGGTLVDDGTSIVGDAPGFVDQAGQDYRLAWDSPCVNAGGPLNPAVLPDNNVIMQYVKHQWGELRPVDGAIDIGAYEYQIQGDVVVDPRSVNLKSSGKVMTAYIGLPAPYSVADIDVSTVYIQSGDSEKIYALSEPTAVQDYDMDGVPELMVKFPRVDVQGILAVGEAVGVTVGGQLTDGTGFAAQDTVRVFGGI